MSSPAKDSQLSAAGIDFSFHANGLEKSINFPPKMTAQVENPVFPFTSKTFDFTPNQSAGDGDSQFDAEIQPAPGCEICLKFKAKCLELIDELNVNAQDYNEIVYTHIECEDKLRMSMKDIRDLKMTIEEQQAEIDDLSRKEKGLYNVIATLERKRGDKNDADAEDFKAMNEGLEDRLEDMERKYYNLGSERSHLRRQLAKQQEEHETEQELWKQIDEDFQDEKQKVREMDGEINLLKAELEIAENKTKELEDQVEEATTSNNDEDKNAQRTHVLNVHLRAENQKLEAQLQECQALVVQLQEKRLKSELDFETNNQNAVSGSQPTNEKLRDLLASEHTLRRAAENKVEKMRGAESQTPELVEERAEAMAIDSEGIQSHDKDGDKSPTNGEADDVSPEDKTVTGDESMEEHMDGGLGASDISTAKGLEKEGSKGEGEVANMTKKFDHVMSGDALKSTGSSDVDSDNDDESWFKSF